MKYLITMAFLLAPAWLAHSQPDSSTITGHISSAVDGGAIAEALVILDNNLALEQTDSTGVFLFDNVTAGKHTLRVLSDHKDFDTSVTVVIHCNYIVDIVLRANCYVDSASAVSDIASGKARLFVIGGIAPISNSQADLAFEHRYGITYEIFGCVQPAAHACFSRYNKEVFRYLDQKYHNLWRISVRDDVVGLRQ